MIRICYEKTTPRYDAYLGRVKDYISGHMYGPHDHLPHDPEIQRFINLYFSGQGFCDFMNKSAAGLRDLIANVERNFPQLQDCRNHQEQQATTPIYQFLKYHFVKRGYEEGYQVNNIKYSLPKDELIDSVGANVCPYCNRTFIYTSKKENGVKVTHAELDHFYSKDLFPYLAIAKYNLVPSCSSCNRLGGKYTVDAYAKHMVNPFEIQKSDDFLNFKLRIKNANVTSLNTLADGLSLKLIANNPNMKKNVEILNLNNLYQHHTDYAAELYFKWLVKATQVYRNSLKGILRRQGIKLSDDDIKRIIVGNYVKEQDYSKRPLSKMMHDIAKDLGLI